MKKLTDGLLVLIGVGFVVYLIFKIGQRSLTTQLLKNNAQITKAVIIDHRNYNPNDDVKPEFTYSYEFRVDGKSYVGDSHDKTVSIGDTIRVEYVKGLPSLNRPLHSIE